MSKPWSNRDIVRYAAVGLIVAGAVVAGAMSTYKYIGGLGAAIYVVTFTMVSWRVIRQDMLRRASAPRGGDGLS
jgi:hypothetical protein